MRNTVNSKNNPSEKPAELRRRAEESAREETAHLPEDLAALSAEETRRTLHELRVMKQDGTSFWALLAATAAQDADGAPVCCVVMSVSDKRKLAEEA
jgi:hypothetical protein